MIRWCRTSAGACAASPAASGSLSLILRNPQMQRSGARWLGSERAAPPRRRGARCPRDFQVRQSPPAKLVGGTRSSVPICNKYRAEEVSILHSLGHLQPSGANSTTSSSTSYNFTLAIGDVAPATRVVVGLREALLHPTLSSPPSLLAGGGARLVAAPRALLTQLTQCKFHLHRTQHTVSQTHLPKNYH